MRCDRCNEVIEEGEEREHSGKMLCEICYMDAVSPLRTCDPWAVYGAKTFEKNAGGITTLTPNQTMILEILEKTGGLESEELLLRLDGKLSKPQLEREFATLRHLERARAEKRGDKVFLILW
ncbi:MAG: hypothetical protein SVJ22_10715 [Halobacteriota archaeon]|nr:hypothetical protein [Halobacteriota archaeon]